MQFLKGKQSKSFAEGYSKIENFRALVKSCNKLYHSGSQRFAKLTFS